MTEPLNIAFMHSFSETFSDNNLLSAHYYKHIREYPLHEWYNIYKTC